MQETAHATFVLDDQASGCALPAGAMRLKGWAVAKPGYFLTDLRVRSAGRVFPGCYGHPRTDLAQYFKAREPWLLAGYEVDVLLAEGENRLEFEGCEIAGQWLPLATVDITGRSAPPGAPARVETVGAHVFTRALRLVLQRAAGHDPAHAADAVAAQLPVPHVIRYPSRPFHGHLDHPPMLQLMEFGRVIVEGWLFHETERIRRVAATVDLQAWQILEHNGPIERKQLAGDLAQFPRAENCGIRGAIDVPAQLPQPLSVRVYAELEDGSWHLCHVERKHLDGDEQAKAPYAPFSLATFLRCGRELRRACQRRGLPVPLDRWFFRGLREVWEEYRARAPRPAVRTSAASPAPASTAGKNPGRVVLITHNLNFEGAPLFLAEFAAQLSSQGAKLRVITATEGPLRARFEAMGAAVERVEIAPLLAAKNAPALQRALSALAPQVDLGAADLVVVNTLSAYWGVHLAHRAGRRSLWYIHESTTPDSFYFGHMAPATLPVIKDAFGLATHVSFLTDTTRRYYLPLLVRPNHSINPGWIDLQQLDRFRAGHSREQLRAQLGLPESRRLVVNIGSVCNRKGQHIFARAVDLLWRRQPALAGACEFLMVGGRDTAYDAAIARLVDDLHRPNLRVIPETSEPYVYYGAADCFVCSSYEESFPRVVLEAMAFGLPIVSTDVHGIPEMTRPGREAVLVPAGDSAALATAMGRVLGDSNLARSLATAARARVVANYDSARLLPHHVALAASVTTAAL